MRIWKSKATLDQINQMCKGNMLEHLGMRFTRLEDDFLEMTMPVDHRTRQVAGLLHGGASVALAESAGSIASYLCLEGPKPSCVGVEINANHLKAVQSGEVTATVRPIRLGRNLHVWDIQIRDPAGELVCVCRLTTSVRS